VHVTQQRAIGIAAASLLLGTLQTSVAERYGMRAPTSTAGGDAADHPHAMGARNGDRGGSVLGGPRPRASDAPYPGYRVPRLAAALPAQIASAVILRGYPSTPPPTQPAGGAR